MFCCIVYLLVLFGQLQNMQKQIKPIQKPNQNTNNTTQHNTTHDKHKYNNTNNMKANNNILRKWQKLYKNTKDNIYIYSYIYIYV